MQRPIFTKGGPLPAMRALANHDRLTRRKAAVSFGVSRRSVDFESRAGFGVDPSGSASFAVGARDPIPSWATGFRIGIALRLPNLSRSVRTEIGEAPPKRKNSSE